MSNVNPAALKAQSVFDMFAALWLLEKMPVDTPYVIEMEQAILAELHSRATTEIISGAREAVNAAAGG